MDEYISKKAVEQVLRGIENGLSVITAEAVRAKDEVTLYKTKGAKDIFDNIDNLLRFIPAADVQPLSVVAEHIKNKLYNTAYYTGEAEARNAIVDMAGHIDLWINELKDGDTK